MHCSTTCQQTCSWEFGSRSIPNDFDINPNTFDVVSRQYAKWYRKGLVTVIKIRSLNLQVDVHYVPHLTPCAASASPHRDAQNLSHADRLGIFVRRDAYTTFLPDWTSWTTCGRTQTGLDPHASKFRHLFSQSHRDNKLTFVNPTRCL